MKTIPGRTPRLIGAVCATALLLSACGQFPGKPKPDDRYQPPETIVDFNALYVTNCRACHSSGEYPAPSIAMNNALYLALIPRDVLRKVTSQGVPGYLMPGFEKGHGGELTDKQVDALVDGIYGLAKEKPTGDLPPYSAPLGDAGRGATAFNQYCSSCHGGDGNGGNGGSIVNPDYLHLVSDQYLRSVTIAGRPEIGHPDYRHCVPNKAMSNEEIADVVAWLSSQRRGQNPEMAASAAQPSTSSE